MPPYLRKFKRPKLQAERIRRAERRWERLQERYGNPQEVTYRLSMQLKKAGEERDLMQGQVLWDLIRSRRSSRTLKPLVNLSIEMFGKCGSVAFARQAFDYLVNREAGIAAPDEYSFVLMLQAYADNGHLDEARKLFLKMHRPQPLAWTVMILAYGDCGEIDQAKQIFDWGPKRDPVSTTAMLHVYADNGHLEEAKALLDSTPEPCLPMVNAMIGAYGRAGRIDDARTMFDSSRKHNLSSYISMFRAYALNGQQEQGQRLLEKMRVVNVTSLTAVIAAYGTAGMVKQAKEVFESMEERTVVSWNAMVATFGYNGNLEEALEAFKSMPVRNQVSWNTMIEVFARCGRFKGAIWFSRLCSLNGAKLSVDGFISILASCNSPEEARLHFGSMVVDFGLLATKQHYEQIVHSLTKARRFDQVRDLAQNMPFEASASIRLEIGS